MKLSSNIILFVIILFSIGLFYHTGNVDPESGNIDYYGNSTVGSTNSSEPYIWDFVTNPDTWESSNFLVYIIATFIVTLTLTGIIAGLFRMQASDATLFSPLFIVLVSFGGTTIFALFNFLRTESATYMCSAGTSCMIPSMLAVVVAGGLAIEYVMSCIQWWRTGFIQG